MNQTCPMEDSFKVPFCLGKYFAPPSATLHEPFGSHKLHADAVINPYRVVGYGEWQYTRGLSMVGEVAGQAEFCFTSIHQRVCRWPLRARLHYGHPDLMDGYWVRTRGGLSHASHLVNTAEDVFAGYEVVARGERVEYIEWLQVVFLHFLARLPTKSNCLCGFVTGKQSGKDAFFVGPNC